MEQITHTQAVKEISEYFLETFISTKSSYPIDFGYVTQNAVSMIYTTAIETFNCREQETIERDDTLGINEIDYLEIAHDAFSDYMRIFLKEPHRP